MVFVNFSVDWDSTSCTCYTNHFSLNWTMSLLACFIMQSEEHRKETSEKTQTKSHDYSLVIRSNYVMSNKSVLCPEVSYMSSGEVLQPSTDRPHSGFHDLHNALPTSDVYSQGKPCWLFILLKWSFKTCFLQVHSVFHNKGRLPVTFLFFPTSDFEAGWLILV